MLFRSRDTKEKAQFSVDNLTATIDGLLADIQQNMFNKALAFRDARITTIYEGTTAIQANDFVGRKLAMDRGAAMQTLLADMRATLTGLEAAPGEDLAAIRAQFAPAVAALEDAAGWVVENYEARTADVLGAAFNLLMLAGCVCGGWQLARAALVASEKLAAGEDPKFYGAKLVTARFYAEQLLPRAAALLVSARAGATAMMALDPEQL